MPGFAIVDVIGKTDVAAAVEFLPKMARIGLTPPPLLVVVAFVVANMNNSNQERQQVIKFKNILGERKKIQYAAFAAAIINSVYMGIGHTKTN